MPNALGSVGSGDGDFPEIIDLNVGGYQYTTRLSTLLREPDSMLHAMFSGRHTVSRDREGRYFIDRDGDVFSYVLAYLRDGVLPHGPLPTQLAQRLVLEAEYLQLRGMTAELRLHGAVLVDGLLDVCRRQLGPDYDSFKRDLVVRAIELSRSSRQPRPRALKVYSSHAPCCQGLDAPKPHAVRDVVSTLQPNMVDFVSRIPNLDEWKDVLLEDLRLLGHEVTIRGVDRVQCAGREGNYGESCTRGPRGTPSVIGSIFEISFGALWGKDCIHATHLPDETTSTASSSSFTPSSSRARQAPRGATKVPLKPRPVATDADSAEDWLSNLVDAIHHRVWPV